MLRVLIFLSLWMAFVAGPASAQAVRFPGMTPTPTPTASPTPPPEPKVFPCPNVSVQAQTRGMVREGQPITFVANIAGGDPKVQPTILWNLSAGSVTDGQGTRRITVDTAGAGSAPDGEIKADLWVGGYAPECVLQAAGTVKVIPPARKFGEFGELPAETVSVHMKTLAEALSGSNENVQIIAYAGRKSERGFALNWLRRMRAELTAAGVSPGRINTVDGGFREEPLFDFWIVPPGAIPPRPEPTVDRKEIVYPNAPPPRRRP